MLMVGKECYASRCKSLQADTEAGSYVQTDFFFIQFFSFLGFWPPTAQAIGRPDP